jgi:hypothetical protein
MLTVRVGVFVRFLDSAPCESVLCSVADQEKKYYHILVQAVASSHYLLENLTKTLQPIPILV